MAKFAALDAAKAHKGEPAILSIRGLDSEAVRADEDSRESDPKKSLDRIGSIAYVSTIPASKIKLAYRIIAETWTRADRLED